MSVLLLLGEGHLFGWKWISLVERPWSEMQPPFEYCSHGDRSLTVVYCRFSRMLVLRSCSLYSSVLLFKGVICYFTTSIGITPASSLLGRGNPRHDYGACPGPPDLWFSPMKTQASEPQGQGSFFPPRHRSFLLCLCVLNTGDSC